MTKEFELYHGIVFSRLLHATPRPIKLSFYPSESNSSYIIEETAGLYIKHSTKRAPPWKFTFTKFHQDEILEMYQDIGEVFVAFVCYQDGVAILNFSELKQILDDNHEASEWVSISRRRRQLYTITGSNGKLNFKVSQKSCPDKIIDFIKLNENKSEQSHNASFFPKLLNFLRG